MAVILALGAARLLRDAALVLLDAAPDRLPTLSVQDIIETEPGVIDVVQLRVWTLGAGHDAVAVSVRVAAPDPAITARIHERLREALGIEFVTVEIAYAGGSD